MKAPIYYITMAFSIFFQLACSNGSDRKSVKSKKPYNVVFIAVDDMNDWTGFMNGHPQTLTPNMNALAKQGVVFTNANCATAECNPSRVSLLTGYHPKTTGFTNNFLPISTRQWKGVDEVGTDVGGYSNYPIPNMQEVKTMPQWFKEHGYYTMGTGKIFHHSKGAEQVDRVLSWDHWENEKGVSLSGRDKNVSGIFDGKVLWQDWGPLDVETSETTDFQSAQWAANQILEQKGDRPFFLAVGFHKPHDPFYAPKEFFDKMPNEEDILLPPIKDDDLQDIPYMGKLMADKKDGELSEYEKVSGTNKFKKDFRKDVARAYLATIAYVDSCVGVVRQALERSPLRDNTIVVLWSDHGLHLGEKKHYHKFTFWEEALRTNLIMKVPGIPPGVTQRNVNAIDIFPTLVDLCNLPDNYLQEEYDRQGHSLVPLLHVPDKPWTVPVLTTNYKRFHPMTFQKKGETYSDKFMAHGVKTERWKLIEYIPEDTLAEREYELYDLKQDPNEWQNLATSKPHAPIKEKLKALIHKYPGGPDGPQKNNTSPTVIAFMDKENSVSVEAVDIDGPGEIVSVQLLVDSVIVGESAFPYHFDITGIEPKQAITIKATDKAGSSDIFELIGQQVK